MLTTIRRAFLLAVVIGWVLDGVSLAQPSYSGVSASDIASALAQLPAAAPVVYLQHVANLLPDRDALLVGTTLYRVAEREIRSAKLSVFAKGGGGWELVYETDMDARVKAQNLPPDFEIGLREVEVVDLDGDRLSELAVWWDAEPEQGFSLVQYSTVFHILDYDQAAAQFREVTADRIVCNQYNERAILLNVDCDETDEIVVLNEIWDEDTCVICSKRYRIEVWTVAGGKVIQDPAWNDGRFLETAEQFSLNHCGLSSLLRFLLVHSPRQEP